MTSETCEEEALRQIIREVTIELMDDRGTTPESTCEVVAEGHTQLCATVGADRVLALCREIHDSSEPAESVRLQEFFAKFNATYFGGQLGDFTVLAVYNVMEASNEPFSGRVDFTNREIRIALTRHRDSMPKALLHHMAHASTVTLDDREEPWMTEMRRLRELGAPVED